MPQEVSVAKVFDLSLVVIVDDTFCPRLDGADQATSAFVAALVMDDIETLAKEVARAKLPQEKVRGEVADRTAHVVRQLVDGKRHAARCNQAFSLAQEQVEQVCGKSFQALRRPTTSSPESSRNNWPLEISTAVSCDRGNGNTPRSSRL